MLCRSPAVEIEVRSAKTFTQKMKREMIKYSAGYFYLS